MQVEKLSLNGPLLISPDLWRDKRGFFLESHQDERYEALGIPTSFVQDNHAYSTYGVLRGMHFQSGPGQAKLVRVAVGKIYDVIVDIRLDSPTFGQWEGVLLDDEKHQQLYVPVGFSHGYAVISPEAHVLYKVSTPYNGATEKGFRFNDPKIGIKWPLKDPIVSDRDQTSPLFDEIEWRSVSSSGL